MTKLQKWEGRLLKQDGKLSKDVDCCCGGRKECFFCRYERVFGVAPQLDSWIVDLGAGGWTGVPLGYICPGVSCCELVAGEFLLESCLYDWFTFDWLVEDANFRCALAYRSPYQFSGYNHMILACQSTWGELWLNTPYNCRWVYYITEICDTGPNYFQDRHCKQWMGICMAIQYRWGTQIWRYAIGVHTFMDFRGPFAWGMDTAVAYYASAQSDSGLCNAVMEADGRITLNKYFDRPNKPQPPPNPVSWPCEGALPSIITIRRDV